MKRTIHFFFIFLNNMALTYCDSVIDFDLNILQQSGNEAISTIQNIKQNKAVIRLKERIISTESVIKRYCKKKLQLQEIQKKWKNACLDHTEALKKVYDLENDLQSQKQQVERLTKLSEELKQSYEYAETAKLAFKSHVVQLQVLIKEHEQRIENLKSENKVVNSMDTKIEQEHSKKVLALMQKNRQFLCHIQIFRKLLMENKKPNKQQRRILKIYENSDDVSNVTDSNGSESYGQSTEVHDKPMKALTVAENAEEIERRGKEDKQESLAKISSLTKEGQVAYGSSLLEVYIKPSRSEIEGKVISEVSKNKVTDTSIFDPDSEVSNEPPFSVDTGCGSSLACSDVEKGFFSPDYSETNSPLGIDALMMRKEITKAVSVATSPITVICTQDAGTNPIQFFSSKSIGVQHNTGFKELNIHRNCKNVDIQCNISSEQLCRSIEVQCELKSIDKEIKSVGTQCDSLSDKVNSSVKQYLEVSTQSDLTYEEFNEPENYKKSLNDIMAPNSTCLSKFKQHKTDEQKRLPKIAEEEQLNQNEIDLEVTTILKEMRLGFGKITPIPPSPIPHSSKNTHSVPDLDSGNQTLTSQLSVLTNAVMAITSALKMHGITVSNISESMIGAKESSNNVNIPKEKNMTEETEDHLNICTEETVENKLSEKNCNLGNEAEKKSQNISVFETENNLQNLSGNKCRADKTVEMKNDLDAMKPNHISSFPDKIEVDQNNDKLYEKERTRVVRKGKITKLQKMRNNALPKYKIKKELTLLQRNMSTKTLSRKQYIHKESNKKLKSIEILNNKTAYEKALRVVAELRQKEKDTLSKKFGKTIFLKPNSKKTIMPVPSKPIQNPDLQSKTLLEDIEPRAQDDSSNLSVINKPLSSSICVTLFQQSNANDFSQVPNKDVEEPKLSVDIKNCINADNPGENRNVSNNKSLEDLETIKKQEVTKKFNIENKNCTTKILSNENQKCHNSVSILLNNKEKRLDSATLLNKCNTIRQSARLSTKRLSSESEAEKLTSKRQKRSSMNFSESMCEDKTSPSDNLTISLPESGTDNVVLNVLQNNSVVRIHRLSDEEIEENMKQVYKSSVNKTDKQVHSPDSDRKTSVKSYRDLDMFSDNTNNVADYSIQTQNRNQSPTNQRGYFCQILDRYLKNKKTPKPLSEQLIKNIYSELDRNIVQIINLKNNEVNGALKTFAESMVHMNVKHLVAAVVAFLLSPKKPEDVICKTATPPAPPMTKSEQILLYLLKYLNSYQADVNLFDMVMDSIAYKLLKLSVLAPNFEEVESLSHFYAVLCRFTRAKNKLRLFILDAMYCLSYKAIPVIKQCLDVWMHILPLAHMGLARSPLVVTLVYLLHFYRCEDHSGRVQNIRMLLRKRYSFDMGDWNETKILEMLKDAIAHIRDIPIEKKMLRTSLILIAKRNGVDWCQKNIVKKLLLPMIDNKNASEMVRGFCVSVLGAVMRPYPKHMRLHCDIVINQLFAMLEQEESPRFQEALFTSLIYLSRHSFNQVVAALLAWTPSKVSPALEELLKDFVQEKPLKSWYYILTHNAK